MEYSASSNAWMTTFLWNNWLVKLDNQMKKQNKKIILLADNFSGHDISEITLTHVRVEYFPPNCTSVLQPLDQGIIKAFKSNYRNGVMKQIISRIDRLEANENVTLLDALYFIKSAWATVSTNTIKNCFRAAGFKQENIYDLNEDFVQNDHSEIIDDYCKIRNIDLFDFEKYVIT